MVDIATQDTDRGTLTVTHGATSRYQLVFVGPDGLEATTRFDDAAIVGRRYALLLAGGELTGTIERDTEAYGAVWSWLDTLAEGDDWDPSPAEIRDGETTDESAHARRNAAQLAMADDMEDADGDE